MIDCNPQNFPTPSSCYAADQNTNNVCVVLPNGQCGPDPCIQFSTADACASNPMCVALITAGTTSASSSVQCFAMQRVCAKLTAAACQNYPWCLTSPTGDSCSYYEPSDGVAGGVGSSSCLSFPMWSIALIILWVLVMLILGGIILLAIRQRRLDAITEVEESDVQVDNMHIQDNFHPREELDKPFTRY